MRAKIFGCILMILGTSIGAGMLALPVVSAAQPFYVTVIMLIATWFLMTLAAFSLLEVNLWFPSGGNLVSMAKQTLGLLGQALMWVVYLLLLYCLICSYLSAAGDVITNLIREVYTSAPLWFGDIIALLLLGAVVAVGIGAVDWVNRVLMSLKLGLYVFVILLILPKVHHANLLVQHSQWHGSVLLTIVTAFGFAIIVPSIRAYLDSDVGKLKKVLGLGSIIPLVVYLFWIIAVQGSLSRQALLPLLHSSQANSLLIAQLQSVFHLTLISLPLQVFVTVCVFTSFLGVSICLVDFIADGMSLRKRGTDGVVVFSVAYLPPLLIVLLSPKLFYSALQYAGLCCVALLVMMPLLMLYVGRYCQHREGARLVPGERHFLLGAIVMCFLIMAYFVYLLISS